MYNLFKLYVDIYLKVKRMIVLLLDTMKNNVHKDIQMQHLYQRKNGL